MKVTATRPKASITRRLIVTLTGLAAALWLVASSLSIAVMHHELEQSLDSALQEAAQRLLTLAAAGLGDAPSETLIRNIERKLIAPHTEYLTYQLRDADGRVLLSSHAAGHVAFPAPLQRGFHDSDAYRIFTEPSADGKLFLQIAETHAHRHEALYEAAIALVLPMALVVPLSTLAIVAIVSRSMRPVHVLQHEIANRGGGNLAPLGPIETASELAPVAAAVDHLLGRLRAALAAERAFAANSAHELRTPLASALARLQRLRHGLDDAGARDRAQGVEADLRRLIDLTEKLLQLSRADAGIGLSDSAQDLTPILKMVADDVARSLAAGVRIVIDPDPAPMLRSPMDIDAFGIVARNLLENAVLHGSPDEPVRVRIGPGARFAIVNGGSVVPPDKLAHLTNRFERGSTAAKGAGLGLAIVETLLRQSGGRLTLWSPASGRDDGFEAIVELPGGDASR